MRCAAYCSVCSEVYADRSATRCRGYMGRWKYKASFAEFTHVDTWGKKAQRCGSEVDPNKTHLRSPQLLVFQADTVVCPIILDGPIDAASGCLVHVCSQWAWHDLLFWGLTDLLDPGQQLGVEKGHGRSTEGQGVRLLFALAVLDPDRRGHTTAVDAVDIVEDRFLDAIVRHGLVDDHLQGRPRTSEALCLGHRVEKILLVLMELHLRSGTASDEPNGKGDRRECDYPNGELPLTRRRVH
mmetsp:Transcript_71804/g.120071  ORF Transcript_71804/g.120071 Transcript_71804/m.120071 type:complete len:240 (+) Transcript_71804:638-1357(+)